MACLPSASRLIALLLSAAALLITAARSPAATPSNHEDAFRRFDLHADRSSSAGTADHLNLTAYPAALISRTLLVTRTPDAPDTVAIFRSTPNDAMLLESNAAHPVSYAAYSVQPPRHFTSLGTLVMGSNVYSGPGLGFQDAGKILMRASITYEDGDTSSVVLRVGANVRTWFNSGPLTCSGPQALYTARPSDPLSGWIFESATHHYDVQELLLDPAKRHKRVATIRLDGVLLDHACPPLIPHITASSIVFGLAAWPDFQVRDAQGDTVVWQSQVTNQRHGGYLLGSEPVGTRRFTNETACQVASMAMSYTYAAPWIASMPISNDTGATNRRTWPS